MVMNMKSDKLCVTQKKRIQKIILNFQHIKKKILTSCVNHLMVLCTLDKLFKLLLLFNEVIKKTMNLLHNKILTYYSHTSVF